MENFNQVHSQLSNIPEELRMRNNWCISGPDKVPMYHDRDGMLVAASVTNPATWMSFEYACGLLEALPNYNVGFVLQGGEKLTCIDLDVVNADTQAAKGRPVDPSQWSTQADLDRYWQIMNYFDSYTERSRSGFGLHIWVAGEIGAGCRRGHIEVYSQERYIICTGNVIVNKPIAHKQDILNAMVGDMRAVQQQERMLRLEETQEKESDDVIWQRASHADNDAKFKQLCEGNWQALGYPSQSEADLALMSMFTFYSDCNEQCRRMFRQTALGQRAKATRDDRYLDHTLKLIRGRQAQENQQVSDTIDPWLQKLNPGVQKIDKKFQILSEDDVLLMPPIQWLVKNMVPERSIGSIFGPSGSGKSFLALDLLAHIANGIPWFGQKVKQAPALYIPLEGQAGIPKRIQAWKQYQAMNNSTTGKMQIQFIFEGLNLLNEADLNAFVSSLEVSNWKEGVLCIDTLAQSAPGVDENSGKEMGPLLAVMQKLQRKLECTVLAIHHTGKDIERGMRGWSGLYAAMDFAFECKPSSENEELHSLILRKVKDGQNGHIFKFALKNVFLYHDDDHDPVYSNVVSYQPTENSHQSVSDIDKDKRDDNFIYNWVKEAVDSGKYLSARSIKANLNAMKSTGYKITLTRIDHAINRLKSVDRLYTPKEKSPNGNVWISYVSEATPENKGMDSEHEIEDNQTDPTNEGDEL